MRGIDWLLLFILLVLGSCSAAVVGSAAHCVYTGVPGDCPRIYSGGKCVHGLLGCEQ